MLPDWPHPLDGFIDVNVVPLLIPQPTAFEFGVPVPVLVSPAKVGVVELPPQVIPNMTPSEE